MAGTNTWSRPAIVTGVIVALIVVFALGMGVRQLWREGVFSAPQTSEQAQPAESEAAAPTQGPPDFNEEDEQLLTWLEQEMESTQSEQEAEQSATDGEDSTQETQPASGATTPAAGGQESQAAQSFGGWRSMWADLNLTEAEQTRLREGWALAVARWQNMSPEERQIQGERMRASWERWQNMSEEEREGASREMRGRFEDWRQSGSTELPDMILD